MTDEPGTRIRHEARLRTVRRQRLVILLVVAGIAVTALAMALGRIPATQRDQGATAETSAAVPAETSTTAEASLEATTVSEPTTPPVDITVAWQPSHQADTGGGGWQEYVICGDIVNRTMALMPEWTHVMAWDLDHGLTGSNSYRPKPVNTPAFDAEVALANAAAADVFVSVHNDGGAPSGILGIYLPGDQQGKALAETLVRYLVERTGLPSRGVIEMQLYSLEPERNKASYRCLLEIGDNTADRAYLESPENRQQIATALADGMRAHFATAPSQ